ncbi:MAG: GAF domain-containing sensor histidine kinase [Anaerolineae bacterium]|nr:GAF domain-containing sensor histidine kinase [Anaerolineae bacterium]
MENAISAFFDSHYGQVCFFYGLAFFALGLALWLEVRPESHRQFARASNYLAAFGLMHSIHEFQEMFVFFIPSLISPTYDVLAVVLLAASYLPLVAFGVELLPYTERESGFTARVMVFSLVAFTMLNLTIILIDRPDFSTWEAAASALARYSLAIPGSALATVGLLRQRRLLIEEMPRLGRPLALAAVAFFGYGIIGHLFPVKSIIFPSMFLNSETFHAWFGVPVQVFRGTMALVIAVTMIRTLRLFVEENNRRLLQAQATERELRIAARELTLMVEASHLLGGTDDLDALMRDALDQVVRVIDLVQRGLIYVPGRDTGLTYHFAHSGYANEDAARRALARLLTEMTDSRRAYWIGPDGENLSGEAGGLTPDGVLRGEALIHRIVLPLETRQRVLGTLLIETHAAGPYLSTGEAPTITALARQLAVAIDNADLVLRLRQREARRTELLQRATNAQEAERKRIARELHDDTGQALTAIGLGLRGMKKMVLKNPAVAEQQVAQLEAITTHALEELRHLISDLRPSHLDDLGLVSALRWYAEEAGRRSALKVKVQAHGEIARLSPELETTLFRIAQEAVGNVIKHAGAERVTISLTYERDVIRLSIEDDGHGFDTAAVLKPDSRRAWGLLGIQERLSLAAGEFEIHSTPGQGTRLEVRVPVERQEDQPERQPDHVER